MTNASDRPAESVEPDTHPKARPRNGLSDVALAISVI